MSSGDCVRCSQERRKEESEYWTEWDKEVAGEKLGAGGKDCAGRWCWSTETDMTVVPYLERVRHEEIDTDREFDIAYSSNMHHTA